MDPPALRRRPSKREQLFDGAAQVFNRRGIASVSLGELARELGVTRAGLYYHVADREELVYQCYLRSCALAADDLEAATVEGGDGLGRLLLYVRRMLDPDRPAAAVLGEVAYLPAALRDVVEAEQARNLARLIAVIAGGEADGTIRACDTEVVAETVIGILSWVALSPAWVEGAVDAGFASRTADALCGLLASGVAADRRAAVACPVDVDTLRPPINLFDREATAEQKSMQIIETASQLFNRSGLDGVSIDEITAALGATKGVVYHYFLDKQDLILRCYDQAFALSERFADTAEAMGTTGLERSMIGLHLNVQAHVAGPYPLMPQGGIEALPEEARRALVERATAINERYNRIGEAGMADGSIRVCDFEPLSLAGAGAFGWIQKWLTDGAARKWAIADEIVALFAKGLAPI